MEDLKIEFNNRPLDEKELSKNPLTALQKWLDEARLSGVEKYNAVCLSTVDSYGKPHSRIVLLRQISNNGLVFFTNYQSNKGDQLRNNPNASLNLFWASLDRQIRVSGKVEKTDKYLSDNYFAKRDRESQLGALCSQQSKVIASRNEMEENYLRMEKKFFEQDIPRPDYWGGYRLIPESFEFWQGRAKRLHDRIQFEKTGEDWKIVRLQP